MVNRVTDKKKSREHARAQFPPPAIRHERLVHDPLIHLLIRLVELSNMDGIGPVTVLLGGQIVTGQMTTIDSFLRGSAAQWDVALGK
jgi:hypothetical protein